MNLRVVHGDELGVVVGGQHRELVVRVAAGGEHVEGLEVVPGGEEGRMYKPILVLVEGLEVVPDDVGVHE
jgi:hypothetical protein